MKASIALEELELPYEAHYVDFGKKDQRTPEYLLAQSVRKDSGDHRSERAGRKAAGVVRVGAILLYLAEKTGRLLPADPALRYEAIQWLFFQMAGVGPLFGQVGYFLKFEAARSRISGRLQHYVKQSADSCSMSWMRVSKGGRGSWAMSTRSSTSRWSGSVRNLITYYGARDLVEFDTLKNVPAWLDRMLERPAVQRGLKIPARPA